MFIETDLPKITLAVALAVITAVGIIVIIYAIYKCRGKKFSPVKYPEEIVTLPSKLPNNDPPSSVPSSGTVHICFH